MEKSIKKKIRVPLLWGRHCCDWSHSYKTIVNIHSGIILLTIMINVLLTIIKWSYHYIITIIIILVIMLPKDGHIQFEVYKHIEEVERKPGDDKDNDDWQVLSWFVNINHDYHCGDENLDPKRASRRFWTQAKPRPALSFLFLKNIAIDKILYR